MKFLITTSKSFSIYDKKVEDIFFEEDNNRIYGLTWDNENIYVGGYNPQKKNDNVRIFDKFFNFKNFLKMPHPLKGCHQIFYYINKLYVMNTDSNSIDVLNVENNNWKRRGWTGSANHTHINSIWSDGKHIYVCEHNGRKPPSRIVQKGMNFGKDLDIISKAGLQIHNVYIEDGFIFTCNSANFCLTKIDMKSKKQIMHKRIDAFGSDEWFTRGLCRFGEYWAIGLSFPVKNRADRADAHKGGIAILNNKFEVVEQIPIFNRGQIHEIRAFKDDKCHNGINL